MVCHQSLETQIAMLQCSIAGGRIKGANERSFLSSTNMAAMTSRENHLLGKDRLAAVSKISGHSGQGYADLTNLSNISLRLM